jgi:hypothetical protein
LAFTNYSNGVSSFGIPLYGPSVNNNQLLTGNVWFVNSSTGLDTLSGGGGTSAAAPLKTIGFALTKCVANNNDFIYVTQNSAITVSSATGLLLNVAGVTVIGLGSGSNRPTITLDTANTATITVSVANFTMQNFLIKANFLSIAACFTLTTAKFFTLVGCAFGDTSNVLNFLAWVKSTGAANTVDGLTLTNNAVNGLGTTSVTSFVVTANDIDGAVWNSNTITLARSATAPSLATVTAGVLTNLQCYNNSTSTLQTATTTGALVGVSGTTGTGIFGYNFCATLQVTAASDLLVTAGHKFGFVQNFTAGAADKSGILVPVAFS